MDAGAAFAGGGGGRWVGAFQLNIVYRSGSRPATPKYVVEIA